MISVVLVDDQKLIRQGVRSLLEISERISVAGEASNGREAMAVIEDTGPDVILLDIQMPILDGIGCLRLMRDKGNTTPVIILTTFENPEQMIECTRLDARGYLLKDVSLDQLVAAIETVHQGGTMIQPAVTATILDRLQQNDSPPKALPTGETLTPRETEVLRCLAAGLSNREIGNAVSLTEGTVKNHVSNILAKLNVRDRTRAVLKAIDHGLL